jgi:hypothetical protein
VEKGEQGYVLVPVRSTLWALFSGQGLQLYLAIPCVASLACPRKGHCAGAVVEQAFGHVGKKFGVRLVSKLRAILLTEADFNAMNKEVYGVWMLDNARKYKLIPEEIFSEQNRTADNGGLAKTLFYDIAH